MESNSVNSKTSRPPLCSQGRSPLATEFVQLATMRKNLQLVRIKQFSSIFLIFFIAFFQQLIILRLTSSVEQLSQQTFFLFS
jgi:hypothetical protein